MKNIIPSLKGARDFYPEDMAIRSWLYGKLRQVSEAFGYQEWDGPFLEKLELYAAKSGEELVKEQSYVFPDRGGELITLRPELTPSLARMIAQRQNQFAYPLRWWSFGPFWRYERPQKGRSREFFQWNIDLIGVETPEADAEMISIIAEFFRRVGLTPKQVVIKVNDRRLLNSELAALDIPPDQRPAILSFIDRRSKMPPDQWEQYGLELGLTPSQLTGVKLTLSNEALWLKSENLPRVFNALEAAGDREYIQFDPNIIRGLLYYTGTVFEAFEISGEVKRAILGGGRYDNLMSDVGGEPLPAIGFAMGDVVISLILKEAGLLPEGLNSSPAQVMVTAFSQELFQDSIELTAEIRRAGMRVNCYPELAKLPKQFKFADRMGIPLAVVLGPDEQAKGLVTIKDLRDGSQTTIQRHALVQTLQEKLKYG